MNVYQNLLIKIVLSVSLLSSTAISFADTAVEHAELAAMLRQLELMQSIASHQAQQPISTRSRYYFDYQRLSTDLARVCAGINDYLTPKRAQPRDVIELYGDYQREANAYGRNTP